MVSRALLLDDFLKSFVISATLDHFLLITIKRSLLQLIRGDM